MTNMNDDLYKPTRQSGYGIAALVLAIFLVPGVLFAVSIENIRSKTIESGGTIYSYKFYNFLPTTFLVLGIVLGLVGLFFAIFGARHQDRKHGVSYVALVLNVLVVGYSAFNLFIS
ncbi:MAG: hypothetical protein ACXVO1_06810 [Tumebacillaceae bacterium]